MKFSTIATAAMLILMAAANHNNYNSDAFSPSPTTTRIRMQRTLSSRQTTTTTTTTTTRLDLLAAMESSTVITSLEGIMEGLGSLALLGSVGFGMAFSNLNDPTWSYEYKVGNDGHYVSGGNGSMTTATSADLALLEECPGSVMEKIEEEFATAATPVTGKDAAGVTKTEPTNAAAAAVVVATAVESVKAPSKEILQSTEVAKAEVQKVGVQEVKERMSTKVINTASSTSVNPSTSTPPAVADNQSSSSSMEVAEGNETKNGKKAIAKGVSLILAAGIVAVVRNVVKAYLGRGLL